MPASTSPCSSTASASSPARSTAPRSPASWCAPIPTGTASRTWCANCSTSTSHKQQQSSDWGADKITDAQLDYAASDVLYLHDLKRHLDRMLRREGRIELAEACFDFLQHRIELDLLGWDETDIFAHS